LVAGLDEALGRHIARAAVGIVGDDAHLLLRADGLQHGILRRDLDARDARRREVELGAIGDPGAEDAVVFVVVLGALPALVRHGASGLEQHERVVGRGKVHAPPRVVIDERTHVVDRIVAAEGELEAGLAVLGAVARAGAAAELRDHGVHVADEIDLRVRGETGDLDRSLREFASELGGELRLAVGERPGLAAGGDGGYGGGRFSSRCEFIGREARDIQARAVGERRGHEHLHGVERAVELERGRLDRERGDLRAGREGLGRGELACGSGGIRGCDGGEENGKEAAHHETEGRREGETQRSGD
jgi:hypothetical protein